MNLLWSVARTGRKLGRFHRGAALLCCSALVLFVNVPAGVAGKGGAGDPRGQTAAPRPARPPDIFFVPTWQPIVYQMLELAEVTASDVVYDLGSGDGRIVVLAAQKYGARGVGIEIDPKLVAISRQVARDAEVADRVTFIVGDLFTADFSAATVVTLFLSTSLNRQLEPRLRRDLAPGTRIVSHQFAMGSWPAEKTVRASDGTDLFLWRVAR